jgi:hypothetical protein
MWRPGCSLTSPKGLGVRAPKREEVHIATKWDSRGSAIPTTPPFAISHRLLDRFNVYWSADPLYRRLQLSGAFEWKVLSHAWFTAVSPTSRVPRRGSPFDSDWMDIQYIEVQRPLPAPKLVLRRQSTAFPHSSLPRARTHGFTKFWMSIDTFFAREQSMSHVREHHIPFSREGMYQAACGEAAGSRRKAARTGPFSFP